MLESSEQTTDTEVAITAEPVIPATEAPTPVVAAEPTDAPAPVASEDGAPKTMLEAALQALGQEPETGTTTAAEPAGAEGAPAPAQKSEEQTTDQGEPQDGVALIPDAEFKALPKNVRTAIVELRKQTKTLRPDAEKGQAVSRYLQDTGISPVEYADLLDVGALLRRDPAAAREVIVKKLAEIDQVLGNTLPPDLHEEVEGGFISEERARELSRTRAKVDIADRDAAERRQAEQRDAVVTAVDGWEAEMRSADAGFASLLPDIKRETRAILLERQAAGNPVTTPGEAVKVAHQAHKTIVDMKRRFAPAPVSTPRVPSSAASAPTTSTAPRTHLEAAKRALGMTA